MTLVHSQRDSNNYKDRLSGSTDSLTSACFAFGNGELPLALIGGGLILDSGEADHTFLFRCQDRFAVYTGISGLRSFLLVVNDAHEKRLRSLHHQLQIRLDAMLEQQGLPFTVLPTPLHVRCDLLDLSLSACDGFEADVAELATAGINVGFVTNQVSPSTAHLLCQLARMLSERGIHVGFDAATCEHVANLALRWHNKASFFRQYEAVAAAGGPPWADTAIIGADELVDGHPWQDLSARITHLWNLPNHPSALFLKSAQDSSGNVSAIVSTQPGSDIHPAFLAEVRRWLLGKDFISPGFFRELRDACELVPSLQDLQLSDYLLTTLRRQQAQRRSGLQLIVQPVLCPPIDESCHPCIGVSLRVSESGTIELIAVNAQLFHDVQRRKFLGVLLDDKLLEDPPVSRFVEQCKAAASVLADQGWRGPINFDGCLAGDGSYWFAGDCNPRLTALLVPLSTRDWLRKCGVTVRSLTSFGYRGEIRMKDPANTLEAWTRLGVLFSARTQRGMLVLPNLASHYGHDLLSVNMKPAEALAALHLMRQLAPDAIPVHLESIHGC
jgi:hypothetical protein